MNDDTDIHPLTGDDFRRYLPLGNAVIARQIPESIQWDDNESAAATLESICVDIRSNLPAKWDAKVMYSDQHRRPLIQIRGPNCKDIKDRVRFSLFPNDYVAIDARRKVAMRFAGHRLFESTYCIEGE